MDPLLPIITRSIVGKDGPIITSPIITHYWPPQLADGKTFTQKSQKVTTFQVFPNVLFVLFLKALSLCSCLWAWVAQPKILLG